MSSANWTRSLTLAGTVGACAAGVAMPLLPSTITFNGNDTSFSVYVGLAAAAGELVAQIANMYLFPALNQSIPSVLVYPSAALTNMALVWGGVLGVTYFYNEPAFEQMIAQYKLPLFGVVAAGVIIAEYVYTHFLGSVIPSAQNTGY